MTDAGPVTIYHNPDCGTSRNALALIRQAGITPQIIEYLKTPPTRETITTLAGLIGLPLRALLRRRGTPYAALGLDDPAIRDHDLLDAIAAHPILLNRPIVISAKGAKLCRPSDVVLDLLPVWPTRPLVKEDGAPFLADRPIAADDPVVEAALRAAGLPTDDLALPGRHLFAYRLLDGTVIGYGGFEAYGADALIRSVVVLPAWRGRGMGRQLLPLLLFRAYEAGARRAFLLTTNASAFFTRLGFELIERAQAPQAILTSRQAAALCPADAGFMTRPLVL